MNDASVRISVRTSESTRQLLARAASAAGVSVGKFMLDAAEERARHMLVQQGSLTLSFADRDAFAAALDSLDTPRPRLAAAMARHREWESAKS